ncbi:unnamed protein product [Cochlearia groenlandica]
MVGVGKESFFDFLKLQSSQWADHFINLTIHDSEYDVLAKEIEALKPKVREQIVKLSSGDHNNAMKKIIHLIHLLERLGLSYHFENDIEETLKDAFVKIDDLIVSSEDDLYTISIMFQVFRTYGHHMSSDVFKRFKGKDGKFEEKLKEDLEGMLSFHEAVDFRTTMDHILDEASSFTMNHMEELASGRKASPPHVLKLIQMAFRLPHHRNSQVIVAREYISFYEQEEDHDETLLMLAKLNFNYLQLHYMQELKTITIWWRELDFTHNFPAELRERIFENWFLALIMFFEPQFSLGRVMFTKLSILVTFLDDVCDIYGSIPQVTSLADCLERWDPDYMGNLQSHMKTAFKFNMYVFKEIEDILRPQGRLFQVEKMIEEMKMVARANVNLINWARGGHVTSFDEYVKVGADEVAANLSIASSFLGLGEIGGEEAFDWLMSRPKLVRALGAKTRILDDIVDFEEDTNKGYCANAILYYMKEHESTKEEAIIELKKMLKDINKNVNEECLKITNTMPRRIILQYLNFSRAMDVICDADDDAFNNRDGKLKEFIYLLVVDPICL